MRGQVIKKVLKANHRPMTEIADRLGMSLSNLSAGLARSDVRTGLLENIAEAAELPIAMFYGDSSLHLHGVGGTGGTRGADSNLGFTSHAELLDLLKAKDEQLRIAMTQINKAQEQMDCLLECLLSRLDGIHV